jgi:cytoskeletal protein RodZ
MTDIAPEPRSAGSHRRNDRGRVRLLLLSLLVVVIAAGAVVATLHWRGEDKKLPAVATKATHPTPSTSSSAPATASSAPTSSAGLQPSSASPSATTGTPLSSVPAGPSSVAPSPSTSGPAAHLPLAVLNSTHTSGLAARAARTLTSGGWTVAMTGNYPHTMSGTTVYYPAGQLAAAQLLASQFPAIRRVVAAPAGVSTTDLTVVLAKDWTASGK